MTLMGTKAEALATARWRPEGGIRSRLHPVRPGPGRTVALEQFGHLGHRQAAGEGQVAVVLRARVVAVPAGQRHDPPVALDRQHERSPQPRRRLQREQEIGAAQIAGPAVDDDRAVAEVGVHLGHLRQLVAQCGQPLERPGGAAGAVDHEIGADGLVVPVTLDHHPRDALGVPGETPRNHSGLDGDAGQRGHPAPDRTLEQRAGEAHRVDL
jgi:hypothetical protein